MPDQTAKHGIPGTATGPAGEAWVPRRLDGPLRQTFRRFRLGGLSEAEAANLTAYLVGLRIGGRPWTINEVERLNFLRSLLEMGRLVP